MKIFKIKRSEHKDKNYFRYLIFLPKSLLEKVGWVGNEEIEAKTEKDKIILSKKKN